MNIVALHSSQSHSGQWKSLSRAVRSELAAELLAPDLVGYGQGAPLTKAAADFRLADELTALTAEVNDGLPNGLPEGLPNAAAQLPLAAQPGHELGPELGPEPVILVGHSYGGALALQWALRYPEQVKGLVLYEPVSFHVLPKNSAARTEIVGIAEQMDRLSAAEAAASFVDYWNTPGYFAKLPERARVQMIAQQSKVQADFHALIDEPTALADYASLQMPVVLVHGTESPLSSRAVAQCLADTIPHCLHLDVAAGHMAPLTQAALVNPTLVNGLRYVLEAATTGMNNPTARATKTAAIDGM